MSDIPLTPEQGTFAAENHGLVLKFLNENHLPEDEYYDIVVFGYLQAVKDYFCRPDMSQYSFSTIAWKEMRGAISNHNRMQAQKKRKADVISIHSGLYAIAITQIVGLFIVTYSIVDIIECVMLKAEINRIKKEMQSK